MREVVPYGDIGGCTVRAAGGEGDSGGAKAPSDGINPSEENVEDDAERGTVGREMGGDEVAEVGFERGGGMEERDY